MKRFLRTLTAGTLATFALTTMAFAAPNTTGIENKTDLILSQVDRAIITQVVTNVNVVNNVDIDVDLSDLVRKTVDVDRIRSDALSKRSVTMGRR